MAVRKSQIPNQFLDHCMLELRCDLHRGESPVVICNSVEERWRIWCMSGRKKKYPSVTQAPSRGLFLAPKMHFPSSCPVVSAHDPALSQWAVQPYQESRIGSSLPWVAPSRPLIIAFTPSLFSLFFFFSPARLLSILF